MVRDSKILRDSTGTMANREMESLFFSENDALGRSTPEALAKDASADLTNEPHDLQQSLEAVLASTHGTADTRQPFDAIAILEGITSVDLEIRSEEADETSDLKGTGSQSRIRAFTRSGVRRALAVCAVLGGVAIAVIVRQPPASPPKDAPIAASVAVPPGSNTSSIHRDAVTVRSSIVRVPATVYIRPDVDQLPPMARGGTGPGSVPSDPDAQRSKAPEARTSSIRLTPTLTDPLEPVALVPNPVSETISPPQTPQRTAPIAPAEQPLATTRETPREAPAKPSTEIAAVHPPTPAPRIPPIADEARIHETLGAYAGAYDRLDALAAQAVWPTVDRRALSRAFSALEAQSIELGACDIRTNGTTATAICRGNASYVTKVGRRERQEEPRRWDFTLQKTGDRWSISSVTTSVDAGRKQAVLGGGTSRR